MTALGFDVNVDQQQCVTATKLLEAIAEEADTFQKLRSNARCMSTPIFRYDFLQSRRLIKIS